MQPPVLSPHEKSEHSLEILPAYLPYLQSPAIKITIKSPILFPVLQDLVDTCTNHEFVVNDIISTVGHSTFMELDESNELINDKFSETSPFLETVLDSQQAKQSSGLLVTPTNTTATHPLRGSLEWQVLDAMNHLLDQVEEKLSSDDFHLTIDHRIDHDSAVTECISDLVDSVTEKMTVFDSQRPKFLSSIPQKKISPARPTTLDLTARSYDQSARNQLEIGEPISRKISSRLSIFVNRCSNQEQDDVTKHLLQNQLVASTLVSPDTPRAKRKYQQLYINGNAYTNLGLKVTTRPTYCCIYRLQPMFVTQSANPQLSMYSQWKTAPVPSGDILEHIRSPHALMSAYNSTEAVFAVSRSRLSLVEVATAATMGGIEAEAAEDASEGGPSTSNEALPEIVKPTGTVTREFLDRVASRLTNYISSNLPVKLDPDADKSNSPLLNRSYDKSLFAVIISQGQGFTDRLAETCARPQFILTHSSHHRLSNQVRTQQQRFRKRSRNHNIDFYKTGKALEMVIASSATNSISSSTYLSQSEQASRLSITETSSTIKLPEMSIVKPRKRSSTTSVVSAASLSSSAFSPFLTMHPMLGHLPSRSKQTVMYIMMMSQAPMSMSVPTVGSLASSKNLASRKFSECIGMKPTAIEENWAARMAADGTAEIMPKRIKIFEGKFFSFVFSIAQNLNLIPFERLR